MIRKIFIVAVSAGFAMLALDKLEHAVGGSFRIVPAPAYHWYHVSDPTTAPAWDPDQWTYSTTKPEEPLNIQNLDGTPYNPPTPPRPREFVPFGDIRRTSEGAWKAEVWTSAGWHLRSCGVAEYLSRDLAEQCVEKAVKDAQGLFGGYRIERRK